MAELGFRGSYLYFFIFIEITVAFYLVFYSSDWVSNFASQHSKALLGLVGAKIRLDTNRWQQIYQVDKPCNVPPATVIRRHRTMSGFTRCKTKA